MSAQISITPGGSPAEQIRDQIRGLIATDQLAAGERLPSVRQLAEDLAVAPGTVAKAYRVLEQEGLLQTRIGGGTRVSATATRTPRAVTERARALAQTGRAADLTVEHVVQVLRAVWTDAERPGRDRPLGGRRR